MDGGIHICEKFIRMKELVSKLSLYDILAMVIPGGTILIYVNTAFGYTLIFDIAKADSAIAWIVSFAVSYILGLINQTLTSKIWGSFRNNPNMLYTSLSAVIKSNMCKCSKLWYVMHCIENQSKTAGNGRTDNEPDKSNFDFCYIIFKYVTITIALWIVNFFIINKLCDSAHWATIVFPATTIVLILIITLLSDNNQDRITNFYYVAYYYAIQKRYSNDIPILEAQVAFLQSMIIPIVLLLLISPKMAALYFENETVSIYIALIITIAAIFFTIHYRQMKIYQRVWEDYEYL